MKKKQKPHDLEDKINAHAWKSPAFKKKLLTNPKAALSEFINEPIPGDISIKVIEEGKNEFVIVLHPLPAHADEMSDEELKKLAGGTWPTFTPIPCPTLEVNTVCLGSNC